MLTSAVPLLAGVSVFCLTMRRNLFVTNLFGGSMANEGLGTLSLSFDWTMISAHGNPLWLPLQTLMNTLVGYILGIGIFMGVFYGNVWNAKKYPFLSPMLFSQNSTDKKYVQYNQTAILNSKWEVDPVLLAKQGLPYLTATSVLGKTVLNIGIMAAISHMTIWHWDDLKIALEIFSPLKKTFKPKEWDLKIWKHKSKKPTDEEAEAICPHYKLMQAYDDVPMWWFGVLWIFAACVGLLTSRLAGSTLEVWAFLIAITISAICGTYPQIYFGCLNADFSSSYVTSGSESPLA
jgi:hypothetical protein